MTPTTTDSATRFFGTTVVRAAFVLAVFGWGLGFYGPPIYLHAVVQRTGWPLAQVSLVLTWHFLCGAALVSQLPRIHRRLGLPASCLVGATSLALGVMGWALAASLPTLVLAATLTGAGWATLGGAAINAIVAPWYGRGRPLALAKAYNGASVGGMLFSPLLVALAAQWGPVGAAALIGICTLLVVGAIAIRVLPKTPAMLGQDIDGVASTTRPLLDVSPLPACVLWRDRRLQTLAAAMALGLFAQVGMIAHLFGLLAGSIGTQAAGAAMSLMTACAILGRTVVGKLLPPATDRRRVAAGNYAVQLSAACLLMLAGTQSLPLTLVGVVLLGLGIGNATSLPPLVAQVEFSVADSLRVVAWIVAISQALFAFAPAAFAMVLQTGYDASTGRTDTTSFFAAVALVQALAAGCMLLGRKPPH